MTTTPPTDFVLPLPLLQGIELYGWKPDPVRSRDSNYMDLCMIVTRYSQLKQGSMACILVRSYCCHQTEGSNNTNTNTNHGDKPDHDYEFQFYKDILVVANNMPFYKKNDSEIHAEIAAIGKASRQGLAIDGATAYITMPPCKRCLPALSVAGIQRIVSRHPIIDKASLEAISTRGMSYHQIGQQEERMERINQLVKQYKERNINENSNDNTTTKRETETNTEVEENQQKRTKRN
ncbi:dCMP deaminase [Nitzschia inconspicua]|uniref:dCMP deaminase n=1 Tax=Nitzschia inconspicua TaxID=303405 RepID=A0A9K3LVT7_9STRA|nr:dCMP deaminase [Nitzschia inconspicua]